MTHHTAATGRSGARFRLIGDIISELKKVTWLKPIEVRYLTVLVLVVAIVAGIILGLLDLGFTNLVDRLLLSGG